MDQDRLINLWNEYQSKKDTYTPEQQEAMENKFWTLVDKAMWEQQRAYEEAQKQQLQEQIVQYGVKQYAQKQTKVSKPKDNRVTL